MKAAVTPLRLSAGLLVRNVGWNLVGQAAPLLVGIVATPLLIHGLGTDRFGILALAWVVIGYFSLFDLGLGRALTQLVASRLGARLDHELPSLVWTALSMMVVFGILAAACVGLVAPLLVENILRIPRGLRQESVQALYVLAVAIPVVIGSAGLRGILEARQRFGLVNAIRIPLGIFTFIGPLLALSVSNSLFVIVVVLIVGRLAGLLAYLRVCFRVIPMLGTRVRVRREAVMSLVHLGTWMTVTNVVGPLMVYLDRFLIGAMISVTAVAYYATPNDLVTRLLVIPGALTGVLFPAFATSFAQNPGRTAALFSQGVKYTFLAMFPITLVIVGLAHDGLGIWIGNSFAAHSTEVLQLLAVGVFVNSLAQVPFALIQGVGRPDLTGRLHLVELPLYLIVLWWLLRSYGIEGAAAAWLLRVSFDCLALFVMARYAAGSGAPNAPLLLAVILAGPAYLALAILPSSFAIRIAFLLVMLPSFLMCSWIFWLRPDEKIVARSILGVARLGRTTSDR